jgi:uncharacterized protein YfeS
VAVNVQKKPQPFFFHMMTTYVMAKSYNCYGGFPSISFVLDFLLTGAPNFGDAIQELSVTLHLVTGGPPKRTLEKSYEEHHQRRQQLPKVVFRRSRGQMNIDIASECMDGNAWKHSPTWFLPVFTKAVDEVLSALPLMKPKLKRTDAFDVDGFLSHCISARTQVPASHEELQVLATNLKAADEARRNAMSPWEKLGIEWQDFHPKARELLDDTFFWGCADDFAPHGNDTGADLLTDYQEWHKRSKDGCPMTFLKRLVTRWGYPELDSMDAEVRNEAAIALAFAELKLRACCNGEVRNFALDAIRQQRQKALVASDWSYRDEKLSRLRQLEEKLMQFAE